NAGSFRGLLQSHATAKSARYLRLEMVLTYFYGFYNFLISYNYNLNYVVNISILILGVINLFMMPAYSQQPETNIEMRLSGWNIDWMKKVRKSISQDDSEYNPAFVQLVVSADRVMEEGLYSVTFKNITPPG